MSSQKNKTELLVFGYMNQETDLSVPIAIIKLIQLFYDIYFYFSIKNEKMQKFLNAKNADSLWSDKTFKIKGITFKIRINPNGGKSKHINDIGCTICSLCLLELPSNIEYFGIYYHFDFEAINCKQNVFRKFTEVRNRGVIMTNFSKFTHLKQIDLNCFVDIKYIKYKSNVNKTHFLKPIKIKKKVEYEWNIKGELIEKCKTFKYGESISSDFGDNNWYLIFFPNGTIKEYENKPIIFAKCLIFPFGINCMEIKAKMSVRGDINSESRQQIIKLNGNKRIEISWSNDTFSFNEFKSKQSISIHIELEIAKLWDENDKIVDKNNWSKYDIIV